jgi:hypothetical protein
MKKGNNLTDSTYLFPPSIPANVLISFLGVIDSNAETYLITQVETTLDLIKCRENYKTKVMDIMVELLQNILHHSPALPLAEKIIGNTFQLEKRKGGFIISASNFIAAKNRAALTKRIEYLNSLTPDELASLYRDILKNGNTERETAGLGLIDIRRKSGKPILFKFELPSTGDTNFSFFTVKVLV